MKMSSSNEFKGIIWEIEEGRMMMVTAAGIIMDLWWMKIWTMMKKNPIILSILTSSSRIWIN